VIRNDLGRLGAGPAAVVTNAAQAAGIGAVRALGRHGVPVVALDPHAGAAGLRSRYAVGLRCPDPRLEEESFVSYLLELAGRLQHAAALFPAGDDTMPVIARHAGALASSFALPFAPSAVLAALSRDDLVRAARQAGIEMADPADAGPEILTLGSYCDRQSRALALFTARVIPGSSGRGAPERRRGVAIAERHDEVSDAGMRLLKALHFHGVSLVAFRPQADGGLRLLSLTPRHWSWHALSDAGGVDLSLTAYRDTLDKPSVARGQSNGRRWRVSLDDVLGEPRVNEGPAAAAVDGAAAADDPLPTLTALAQSLRRRRQP
jgi:predicted ATP-grasp superfamily ATP-dependent carboligase